MREILLAMMFIAIIALGCLSWVVWRVARAVGEECGLCDEELGECQKVLAASSNRINRLLDLQIIAFLHWGARFTDPRNNPFR